MGYKTVARTSMFDKHLSKSLTRTVVGMGREEWADRSIRDVREGVP